VLMRGIGGRVPPAPATLRWLCEGAACAAKAVATDSEAATEAKTVRLRNDRIVDTQILRRTRAIITVVCARGR
jgi:hypothetical protein